MRVLVTGGAGFIGSHLVDRLATSGCKVRVLDDLSTGRPENIHPDADLFEGSITDYELVRTAVQGVEMVFHQAARASVARSLADPLAADLVNTHGTLAVLRASQEAGVRRMVYASSSSVYGGAAPLPSPESSPLRPRSPYAVSKLAGEHYCRVFAEVYCLEVVALRYFNVFGPRQRADSAYAAVIPRFIEALLRRESPVIHGDGRQSRDFTFVEDVVEANLSAAQAPTRAVAGHAYNIARGDSHSLLDLLAILGKVIGIDAVPRYEEPRTGDVRHSQADVAAARNALGFEAHVDFEDGLRQTVKWLASQLPRQGEEG